jgi:hypothetical protein
VACVKEKRTVYKVLVRKPQGKGDTGARWEYNDKTDLKEIEWQSVDWIDLRKDTEKWWSLGNLVINIQIS